MKEPLTDWTDIIPPTLGDGEEFGGRFFHLPSDAISPKGSEGETGRTSFSEANVSTEGDLTETENAEHEELKQLLHLKRQSLVNRARSDKFEELRKKICTYVPGKDLRPAGGKILEEYDIPEITTLLLVGPMGVGKSTLVNNMIRVLNQKTEGFDFAQVLAQQGENGTFLLEEYNVCGESGKVAVFDSRGLPSIDTNEGRAIIQSWMVNGVRHGQKVVRLSDSSGEKENLEARARLAHHTLAKKRTVNFVVLVVSAVSLHQMIKRGDEMAIRNLKRLCTSPYLSVKDDRPVLVMTHGDRLTSDDRIETQIFLGKVLGVSPLDYVFDIAGYTRRTVEDKDDIDVTEDMALLEMLEFALYRADRNLQYKPDFITSAKIQVKEAVFERWNSMKWPRKAVTVLIVLLWIVCAFTFVVCFFLNNLKHGKRHHGWSKKSRANFEL